MVNQDSPTLTKTTPLSTESPVEQYAPTTVTHTPTLSNDSLTYVSFLNTVSSLLSSEGEQDKIKSSHILHSPTDMLVTPFTPQGDENIDSTGTVTVVTSEGTAGPSPAIEEILPVHEKNELEGEALETVSAEEVNISQTVELMDSEVTEC